MTRMATEEEKMISRKSIEYFQELKKLKAQLEKEIYDSPCETRRIVSKKVV